MKRYGAEVFFVLELAKSLSLIQRDTPLPYLLGLQEAENLAQAWGVPYVECSSKTGDNVAEVFHTLLKEIERDEGLLVESGDGGCTIL